MKHVVLLILISLTPFFGQSQEAYRISLDSYQVLEDGRAFFGNQLKLPMTTGTIILGGLNELDGMGSYFNVYGTKLVVDSLDLSFDGTKQVVFRREDGRNFYNLFPTLRAKLIPISLVENKFPLHEENFE